MCTNGTTQNECKYFTQETSCLGPVPYKCQCQTGKYFNRDLKKCEILKEIDEICLQTDSCKNGICIGLPSKCQNQRNNTTVSSLMTTILSTTTTIVVSSTKITKSSSTTKSKLIK
jgi:hypothetical protein